MRIGKIANSMEYRMDEQFQNLPILVIRSEKILEICQLSKL